LLTHILKIFHISLEDADHINTYIPTINESIPKSLKSKPLSSSSWKHEEEISIDDIETLASTPWIIPPTYIEQFQEDVKEIVGELSILKDGQIGIT